MISKKISPSMMCVDNLALKETLQIFENNGIAMLHLDIMDGHFVPNIALGTDWCKQLKNATTIPLDYHLMVENPENMLDWFAYGEGDYLSFHYESTSKHEEIINKIKQKGAKVGLVIKPATPVKVLEPFIKDLDFVLIMTVNPGFAGQKLVEETLEKIGQTRDLCQKYGNDQCLIEVDGNVSFDNARRMSKLGADVFVAGSSSVFAKNGKSMAENICNMQRIIDNPYQD